MNFAKNQSLKIFLTSFIILLIGIIIIYSYNYSSITKNHLKLADDMVSEISVSIEYHILEKVKTVKTIAIAPVILKALQVSNEHYSRLSEQKRAVIQKRPSGIVKNDQSPFVLLIYMNDLFQPVNCRIFLK